MKFILSIDGGGSKAIIAAQFLYHLEQYLLERFNKNIFDIFDMYVGTSSGSMIIAPLVYKRYTASYILNQIFSYENTNKTLTKNLLYGFFGFRPVFKSHGKTSVIQKYSKNKYISMNDTHKDCLITGYNINDSEPLFFKSYTEKLKEHTHSINLDINTIVDISSAAPGFFPAISININSKKYYFSDGAIFALNPTDCAYADALKLYGHNEDIRILSIGLGHSIQNHNLHNSINWGPLQWLYNGLLINRVTYANIPTVHYRMLSFTEALNHKYLRIEPKISKHHVGFYINKKIYNELKNIGTEMFINNKQLFDDFFNINSHFYIP